MILLFQFECYIYILSYGFFNETYLNFDDNIDNIEFDDNWIFNNVLRLKMYVETFVKYLTFC